MPEALVPGSHPALDVAPLVRMGAAMTDKKDQITPADLALALRVLAPGDDDNVTLGELRRETAIPPDERSH